MAKNISKFMTELSTAAQASIEKVPGLAEKKSVDVSAAQTARILRESLSAVSQDAFVKAGVPKEQVGIIKKVINKIFKNGKTLRETINQGGITYYNKKGKLTKGGKILAIDKLEREGLPANATLEQEMLKITPKNIKKLFIQPRV